MSVLADVDVRGRLAAGCPPLPTAMFEERLPPSPGWTNRPGVYLTEEYARHVGHADLLRESIDGRTAQ